MSLETQLIALATQIGIDVATLQSALATAQSNLQSLQEQVGDSQTSGLTLEAITALLGNTERDLLQVYRDGVMSKLVIS